MENKKRAIVSVTNDIYTDQRVRKVCEYLVKKGYSVTLCGRLLKDSLPLEEIDYKRVRFKLPFVKGPLFYAVYNIRLFFYLLFHKSDVLVSNDLDTLLANYLVNKFKRKSTLIYDSHEYFIGVPEIQNKPSVKKVWQTIERFTLPKVDKMYTVNDSIANLYKKEYGIPIEVVRNIADPKAIKNKLTKEALGLPLNKKIVIIQGAGINIDRGAEEAIEAIKLIPDTVLIFVGNGDVIPLLKVQVEKEKLEEKVIFYGKRSYEELMNFTMHADLGLSIDKNTNINYQFSLPNKIFDYIHAGIPLLVSNLTEIAKIVTTYEIGEITYSHDPIELAEKMKNVLFDETKSNFYKENTKLAAKELTWYNETKVLDKIYE